MFRYSGFIHNPTVVILHCCYFYCPRSKFCNSVEMWKTQDMKHIMININNEFVLDKYNQSSLHLWNCRFKLSPRTFCTTRHSVESLSRDSESVHMGRISSTHKPCLTTKIALRWYSYTEVKMADVSERTLQVAIAISFATGFLAGWQGNRMRRKFLDWRKKRLQDKLAETQKKLDLAWGRDISIILTLIGEWSPIIDMKLMFYASSRLH